MEFEREINKERYKKTRDYQSALIAFYIGLLNKQGSIEVMKQAGRTLVALPFLQIVQIRFDNEDIIEFHEFIEKRVKELMNFDISQNIPIKTAALRMKKNRIGESLNFLHDILLENGYYFVDKIIGGRNNSMCIDISKSVFNETHYYNSEDILKIGEKVCDVVIRRIGIKYSCTFPSNDFEIQSFYSTHL